MDKELYLDSNHNIVSEKKAVWKVIHKYGKKGNLLNETWIDLKHEK